MAKQTAPEVETYESSTSRNQWWKFLGGAVVVAALLVGSFELVYAGKVFPGVTADGVSLGGSSQREAKTNVTDGVGAYASAIVPITYGTTTLSVPVKSLNVSYDTSSVTNDAYNFGRTGSIWERAHAQLRALLGRKTNFTSFTYDNSQLTSYVNQMVDDISTPVTNASLTISNNQAQAASAVSGHRLDIGLFVLDFENNLGTTSTDAVAAPIYDLAPVVTTSALTTALPQVNTSLAAPLQVTYGTSTTSISQDTIASWVKITGRTQGEFADTHDVRDLYPLATTASLAVDKDALTAYVTTMASQVDRAPVDARLAMSSGQLSVLTPSQDGLKLDQTGAIKAITAALTKTDSSDRAVKLDVTTAQAAVRADNLASLGITDQLSEGETYFPGSPSARLTNVRAGAARFNNVLLSPGQVFSFGALLGEVDASTGYVPELVILAHSEEKQYGGGLCQVSSTAFRAALNAGLPIDERVSHSFAISYYTWPYTVPGVDAALYYPDVDLKFTNDTGHYILIQTTLSGYDLKFDFYGTKTKTGTTNAPTFITGTNDAKQASHTVFTRDIKDLSGNIIKTDTFNTYYQPSTNFPAE